MARIIRGAEVARAYQGACSPPPNRIPPGTTNGIRRREVATFSREKHHFNLSSARSCRGAHGCEFILPKPFRCNIKKLLFALEQSSSRVHTKAAAAAQSCVGGRPATSTPRCRGECSNAALPTRLGFMWTGGSLSRWRCPCRNDEAGGVDEVVTSMQRLLQGNPSKATKAAKDLVTCINQQGRAALLSALFSCVSEQCSAAVQFREADTKADGVLDQEEFTNFVEAQEIKHALSTKPLTRSQIFNLAVRAAIGMVGFGFVDNAVMIIAGDAIEHSIGATFGLSTMTSAGLGNTASDLLGTAFCGYIEGATAPFMPELRASSVQMTSKEAWWAETMGSSIGITIGCLLGLLPLAFINNPGTKESGSSSAGSMPPPPTAPRSSTMVTDKIAKSRVKRSRSTSTGSGPVPFDEMKWCSTTTSWGDKLASLTPCVDTFPTCLHGKPCSQVLGRSVVIVAVTLVMALKRLSARGNHLKRRSGLLRHVGKNIEKR